VLYLLHGSGDNEATWTVLGRAHFILDNLIAQNKAKPMLVVMTDGHAAPQSGPGELFRRNIEVYGEDLLGDVMPLVEASYRVKADRMNRAICGLSMGAMQSMTIGLNNLEKFGWIGGMSGLIPDAEKTVAKALGDSKINEKLKLLWIAIGKEDFLLKQSDATHALLEQKGVKHDYVVTEGKHQWMVWRKYLAEFAPRLFR
jgi:enterochelin esterase family protein